jgi:hypothetical protein
VHRLALASSKSLKIYALLTLLTFSLAVILLNHNMFGTSSAATEFDGAGTACAYTISAHVLSCTSKAGPSTAPVIIGPEGVTSGHGICRDNPQCEGRKYKRMGPIEPGKYRMHLDTRAGGIERVRLEPVPAPPGWRVWLPGWIPGSLRGGFLMGLGKFVSHGCIQVLQTDAEATAQYNRVYRLLEARPNAIHELVVVR